MAERLYIEGRRDAYDPDHVGETLTVGELIGLLQEYDEDTPIYLKTTRATPTEELPQAALNLNLQRRNEK